MKPLQFFLRPVSVAFKSVSRPPERMKWNVSWVTRSQQATFQTFYEQLKSSAAPSSLLPSPSYLLHAAAAAAAGGGSPVIFTLWAQRLHPSRCAVACWLGGSTVGGEWRGAEVHWHTRLAVLVSLAEVEAQRSGSAAHSQRPVSGQPDIRRTPGHCSVSPPGGWTVMGAADYHLMPGWFIDGGLQKD